MRSDEAVGLGENDRGGTVAEVELGQDVAKVGLTVASLM